MIRRLTLTAATMALVMLALALPAVAMPTAAAEPFGWDPQLRNAKTPKYGADMTYKALAAYLDGAGLPQWIPDWPLRVVSLDPGIVWDMKVQGVGRLSIVPAVVPTGVAPF